MRACQCVALRHLWRSDGREFVIAMVAMFGVLGQGLLRGVAIGALISLVLLIRRVATARRRARSHPRHAPVSDRERHPENRTIPGMSSCARRELALFQHELRARQIEERVRAEKETKLVVLDLSEVW
jgi:MFS superfamily sulfate permease-like transporter